MARLASLILLVLLVTTGTAWALWAERGMDELARTSDAIVVGVLDDLRVDRTEQGPQGSGSFTILRGTIRVDRVLWSRGPVEKPLVLEWASWNGRPNVRHVDHTRQRILWLLERDEKTGLVYRADNPARTIVLEDPEAVEEARKELAKVARPDVRVRRMKQLIAATAARLQL